DQFKMSFVASLLKIQLAREIGKKEGLPREKNFIECAQEMMDMSARDEEARPEPEETGWNREMRPQTP
ncbi:hypothetical protein, partial [Klebsiella pneumoniae]|uniref:hypothetical protein n=1 Tax=Klebsiella pneumoniae TaxID=573 RepID=UPI00405566B5